MMGVWMYFWDTADWAGTPPPPTEFGDHTTDLLNSPIKQIEHLTNKI